MLLVRDLMTEKPYTVHPETPMNQVIDIIKSTGCRQFPVMDNDTLVGIITDRDVRLAFSTPEINSNYTHRADGVTGLEVGEHMTTKVFTVTPDTVAGEAAEMLSLYKIGALPVVEDDKLVGIITVSDFLDYIATQPEFAAP